MADKSELKQAAFELAMNELRGRLLYEDYVEKNGKVFREQVSAFATRIAEERKSVDEVRRNVPELAGKSYWWDVPYDITKPVEEFPGTFAFSEGIYTEQDDFEETYGLMLARAKQCDTAHDVFNIYLTFSDYVTLYADRKALKVNPAAKVQRKAIYCAEEELPVQKTVGEYEGPRPYVAENTYEYRRLQSEIRSIAGRLPGQLQSFDHWHDSAERILNSMADVSPFTDKERWMMGQMDSDSYYTGEMYRDYRKMEMREKAQEEISRLEYQMEQMRRQAARARAAYQRYEMERVKANLDKGIKLRFMRCGYTFYLDGRLVAIVILKRPERVYQVQHHGTVSPYDIFGRIGSCREVAWETPNPVPLIDFILQEYGTRIKTYSPLAARPKHASDELWRYWAEQRLADFLVRTKEEND